MIKDRFGSPRVPHYGYFLLSMMLLGLAGGLFRGVQDNYLAYIGIGKAGRGVVEFFRELPGLLLFLLLIPFYRMAERNIIRISLAIALLGIIGFLLAGTAVVPVVACLTIWSTGEHLIMPVRRSYAVHSAEPGREGRSLGFLKGVENAGQVAGLALVSLIFLVPGIRMDRDTGGRQGFLVVFVVVGVMLLLAIAAAMRMSPISGSMERKKFYLHKKFARYYGLEMFYGARKQIFMTFGPYLLILQYSVKTEYLATLLGVCALINIFFNPIIGRIIDRIGYRTVMIGDTIILFFVCLAYGFAHHLFPANVALVVVSVIFILDWMISSASMAAVVYISRISDDSQELTSTMSTGISINHLISVAIALVGGLVWEKLGVELLFVLAALMAAGNTLFAVGIREAPKS